MRTWREVRNFA